MDSGFIKLYRKIIDWEWFDKSEMVHIFIFLLVKANHKDTLWRGIDVKRGQLITSIDSIKLSTNLSVQTIRTCLSRLEKSGEINKQTTNKHTVITVCKYDSYHSSGVSDFKAESQYQQTTNKQLTTDKNVKNNKEDNKERDLDLFERFYTMYGNKKDRKKAESAFFRLKPKDIEEIFKVLPKYIASTPDLKYRKYPATWLNARGWEDEYQDNNSSTKVITEEDAKIIQKYHNFR